MLRNTHYWLAGYFSSRIKKVFQAPVVKKPAHIFISICDHFEPLWNKADKEAGLRRVGEWSKKYPAIADKFRDSDGQKPKYSFFYPIEEYYPECMSILAELCHKGYGEVEVHLHHDNDTADNLRKTLIDYKNMLSVKYGLLSKDKTTGEIKYAFIHGNWALDNSRPDGRWCGVSNEISILQETGCYADFTMPSAPHNTQTSKINSIYYAIDDPDQPKSHNRGIGAQAGRNNRDGLLMVQGPLLLNWKSRKYGIFPRIENSAIGHKDRVSLDRIRLWLNAGVGIKNKPEYIFLKLYTHGCQDNDLDYLLTGGLDNLFAYFTNYYNDGVSYAAHFVSAREMVNIIKAVEDKAQGDINARRDHFQIFLP